MTTVKDIYDYLNKLAPFALQMKGDNCGLLVGDMKAEVKKVILCLDATNAVIDEAVQNGVDLIIAHHPIIYKPIKKVLKNDPLHEIVWNNLNFISAHTNLDVADGGITDLMLDLLEFPKSSAAIGTLNPGDTEFGKIVKLDKAITSDELAEKCKEAFGCTVVRYFDAGKPIKKVGVCSGGGGDLVELAHEMGCDAYITGDLRNSRMIYAANFGMTLVDAGHFHTEDIFCEDLAVKMRKKFADVSFEKAENCIDVCSYVM